MELLSYACYHLLTVVIVIMEEHVHEIVELTKDFVIVPWQRGFNGVG